MTDQTTALDLDTIAARLAAAIQRWSARVLVANPAELDAAISEHLGTIHYPPQLRDKVAGLLADSATPARAAGVERGDQATVPDLDTIAALGAAATERPWTAHGDGLVWADRLGDPVSGSTEQADAEFIAAVANAWPALSAEVRRLRAEVEHLRAYNAELRDANVTVPNAGGTEPTPAPACPVHVVPLPGCPHRDPVEAYRSTPAPTCPGDPWCRAGHRCDQHRTETTPAADDEPHPGHVLEILGDGWDIKHPADCPSGGVCPLGDFAREQLAATAATLPPGRWELIVSDLGDRIGVGDRLTGEG